MYETKAGGVAVVGDGSGADGWEISGYASWFNNEDLGGDIVLRGAYSESLRKRPSVPILWQHDTSEPIGKTVLLREDQNGLFFKARLDPTRRGNDARILTKSGTLSGISIGYDAVNPKRQRGVRKLDQINLWEISLVTFQMNPKAQLLTRRKSALRDMLLIAEVHALQAKGWIVDERKKQAYLAAFNREWERALWGKTGRELLYEVCYELQELRQMY